MQKDDLSMSNSGALPMVNKRGYCTSRTAYNCTDILTTQQLTRDLGWYEPSSPLTKELHDQQVLEILLLNGCTAINLGYGVVVVVVVLVIEICKTFFGIFSITSAPGKMAFSWLQDLPMSVIVRNKAGRLKVLVFWETRQRITNDVDVLYRVV